MPCRSPTVPGSLVVLGGGPIGCELAQVYSRFGVRVTVVQHGDRLLAVNEPEASALLADVFAHEGIQVLTGVDATKVAYADGAFTLTLGDGEELVADKLLVAAGRTPNLDDLGLETRRPRPVGTHHRGRRPDAGRRRALGDRGRHRQGRVHPRVDVPERDRAPRHPRRGRPAGGVPRAPARHLHRSRGRGRRDDRGPGRKAPGSRSALAAPSSRSPRAASPTAPAPAVWSRWSRTPIAAYSSAPRSVGPAGGEIIGYLAVAVHAAVPVATLRSMIFAYPTFHRAIESALGDLSDDLVTA